MTAANVRPEHDFHAPRRLLKNSESRQKTLVQQPGRESTTIRQAVILTDQSDYDYQRIVQESRLVIDARNATRGLASSNIVRC
jgi:hypothetical protein